MFRDDYLGIACEGEEKVGDLWNRRGSGHGKRLKKTGRKGDRIVLKGRRKNG